MKTKNQIKTKIKRLEKEYSADGKSIRLHGQKGEVNKASRAILKWVLKNTTQHS